MPPERKHLLVQASRPAGDPARREAECRALAARVEHAGRARDWYATLEPLLPGAGDDALRDYYRFALIGVTLGFLERDLSPYVEAHRAIIPPLLEDIRSVYEQLRDEGREYSPAEFRYLAFDYGIHKAYYLDWTHYMSRELY